MRCNMFGLSTQEAEQRRAASGRNTLAEQAKSHPVRIFVGQFRDVMVMILLVATAVSAVLGEYADALTIAVIVLLNAILGFIQEFRTEKTLLALRAMTAPTAQVWRDGKCVTLPAEELVCGDRIRLEAGDCVPADALILTGANVFAEESILTGESLAVEKHPHDRQRDAKPDASAGRGDVLYAGTSVTRGSADCEVIAIGKATQMGQISQLLSDIEDSRTPLQKRLAELGKVVAMLCGVVCVLVFLAGVLRGEPVFEMLMIGITVAIAAIPEGLPATVTIALALAVRRMLRRGALVNRLHAVETLGCASVICSDKTGTITENKMTVRKMLAGGEEFGLSGSGWQVSGALTLSGVPCNPQSKSDLQPFLRCAVLCNHAGITAKTDGSERERGTFSAKGEWEVTGDPTEIALLVAAAKCGVTADGLTRHRVVQEIPFESETRSMTVFCRTELTEGVTAYRKGAVDVILSACGYYRENGRILPLTSKRRAEIIRIADAWSGEALRVLAFAEKEVSAPTAAEPGQDMVFLGLMGMLDPPREQAKQAIAECVRAGIHVVMLTGDHIKTASAVAKLAGIPNAQQAMTGAELDTLSEEALSEVLEQYAVFARVTPAHKLRLVRAYRAKGKIVTMTGDGVNDAPAVKEADIGVAMGKNGTDVTRQAADVVLMDDRFDTLVAAVEQGRTVYANIRKFVRYLLACNIGEVLTMLLGILMGLPMVLLPTQILLVNLATDGLPAVALGLEPPARSIMRRPPRAADESFFANGLLSRIIFRGIFIALSTLGSFTTVWRQTGGDVDAARTAALVTLIFSQLIHVFECKTEDGTLFSVPYFSNIKLIFAVLISVLVTAAALLLAPMQVIFSTCLLAQPQLMTALCFSFAVPLAAAVCTLISGGRKL